MADEEPVSQASTDPAAFPVPVDTALTTAVPEVPLEVDPAKVGEEVFRKVEAEVATAEAARPASGAQAYRVLNQQINWTAPDGTEREAHAGDVIDDLLPNAIPWLLEGSHIEKA